MPLTLNQFLLAVITLAVVVAVTAFVMLALQLKKTAAEAEKTMAEVKELAKSLQLLEATVKDRLDDVGQTLEAARKVALQVSGITLWLTSKVVQPASKIWPILGPVLRFVWRQVKKRKEGRHVRT